MARFKEGDVADSAQNGEGEQNFMDDFYSFKIIEILYEFS